MIKFILEWHPNIIKDRTELLIKAGANIDIKNNKGETAIDIVTNKNNKEILDIFKKYNHIPKDDINKKKIEELEKKMTELLESFKNIKNKLE